VHSIFVQRSLSWPGWASRRHRRKPAANAIDSHLAAAKAGGGIRFHRDPGARLRGAADRGRAPTWRRLRRPSGRPVSPNPAKVFDNLYFVGTKYHSSWALTTSEGIILIDTLYDYASEEAIVAGLRKLGLDPAAVKYVIISHAMATHVGGAKAEQDRFGSRIVMGGPDWDSIEKSVNHTHTESPSATSWRPTARRSRSATRA